MELVQERRQDILRRLQEQGQVIAHELSVLYGVSTDTIRRDLREMAAEGLLQRVHGGALPIAPRREPFQEREWLDLEAKTQIAQAAAQLVQNNQVVIFDSGTTNIEIIRQLDRSLHLTIITSSPEITLATLDMPHVETIIIGGHFNKCAVAAVDGQAIEAIKSYCADICFLGICSLHPDVGYTTLLQEEVIMKRAIINQSVEVIAVATVNKLDTVAPFVVSPLHEITHLVTEIDTSEAQLEPYKQAGIQLIQA